MSNNGCAHVNTTQGDEGNDSVIRCDACGQEMSRVVGGASND